MKKILLIQSRSTAHRVKEEQAAFRAAMEGLAEMEHESALNVAREWDKPQDMLKGIDGIILGGSGDFDFHGGRSDDDPARATSRELLDRLQSFVIYAFEREIPILGVCFGHQIIAELHGGGVTNDLKQKKVGTHEVSLTDEGQKDELFQALPETFEAQYAHKDSVTSLPVGSTLLATGPFCQFSALRYGPRAYTTQFHPEESASEMRKALPHSPGYVPEGVDIDSIIRESPETERLIGMWIERIV